MRRRHAARGRSPLRDTDDASSSADVGFVVPWTIIGTVLLLTVAVALLMTWLPSRQAGRIAPAEALRYE